MLLEKRKKIQYILFRLFTEFHIETLTLQHQYITWKNFFFFWYSLQDHADMGVLVLGQHLRVTDQCLGRARQNVQYHRSLGTNGLAHGDDLFLVVRWILGHARHVLGRGRFHRKEDPFHQVIIRKATKRDDDHDDDEQRLNYCSGILLKWTHYATVQKFSLEIIFYEDICLKLYCSCPVQKRAHSERKNSFTQANCF